MGRFGSGYLQSQVPEWTKKYVSYNTLAATVHEMASAFAAAKTDDELETCGAAVGGFLTVLKDEANMVDAFHASREVELLRWYDVLKQQSDLMNTIYTTPAQEAAAAEAKAAAARAARASKRGRVGAVLGRAGRQASTGTLTSEQSVPLLGESSGTDDKDEVAHRGLASGTSLRALFMKTDERNRLRVEHKLHKGFLEYYRALDHLKNYAVTNYTAILRLTRKLDKLLKLPTEDGAAFLDAHVRHMSFVHAIEGPSTLLRLIRRTEGLYADTFTSGHLRKAKDVLRPIAAAAMADPVTHLSRMGVFRLGLFVGTSIPLILLIVSSLTAQPQPTYVFPYSAFVAFRFVGLIVLLMWLTGLDFWAFTKARINYPFIFGFEPGLVIGYPDILEGAARSTFMLLLAVYMYLGTASDDLPNLLGGLDGMTYPLTLVGLTLGLILFPAKTLFFGRSRLWLLKTLGHVVTAPFSIVRFQDFYIADQLTSLPLVFGDLEYILCFWTSDFWFESTDLLLDDSHCYGQSKTVFRPIVSGLPFWWRAMQAARRWRDSGQANPHAFTLARMSGSLAVVVASALDQHFRSVAGDDLDLWSLPRIVWMVAAVTAASMHAYGDAVHDWGFFPGNGKFLREETLLGSRRWYVLALVSNTLLRFSWTLTISHSVFGFSVVSPVFRMMLAVLELFRRAQWNFYRLEAEQLANQGQFRAIRVIPVPFAVGSALEFAQRAPESSRLFSDGSGSLGRYGSMRSMASSSGIESRDPGGSSQGPIDLRSVHGPLSVAPPSRARLIDEMRSPGLREWLVSAPSEVVTDGGGGSDHDGGESGGGQVMGNDDLGGGGLGGLGNSGVEEASAVRSGEERVGVGEEVGGGGGQGEGAGGEGGQGWESYY